MVYSFEVENQLLAGLITHPDIYVEISSFINEEDFYSQNSQVNKTIFHIIKSTIESGSNIDYVMLTERVNALGITFEDNINVSDYIQALSLRKINRNSLIDLAKDFKKLSVRRHICDSANEVIKSMRKASGSESFSELIETADNTYNKVINFYDGSSCSPENLFSDMEEKIELRGNNPVKEFGLVGPHKRTHELYGSLLRPGNITTITARSGVGKTQFCLDFCLKTSEINDGVPVLHFDNGEMSKEELQGRLCSSMSGVPIHLIETGQWRQAGKEVVNKVRAVWPKIQNLNVFYYNVAGLTVDQMTNLVKRFYYSKVGRGKKLIFNYDYIKTTSESSSGKMEWQVVGEMMEKFKRLIHKDILYNNEPMIAMMTSVQSNRIGITNNRRTENIVEDESIVSLSDRINQLSSHLFSLRKKTDEETLDMPEFGTHKLIAFKTRHLGENAFRAINRVRMEDGSLSQNAIFLDFNNFKVSETGDLQDFVESQELGDSPTMAENVEEIPDI